MLCPRDSQKQRVYDAQKVIAFDPTNVEESVPTVPEVQKYIDEIVRSAWFRRRWPRVDSIEITDARGRRQATAYYYDDLRRGLIKMPRWARCEAIILHEVAHVCNNSRNWICSVAGHGREFAATYLELVDHCMHKTVGDKLRASFREHGVKWHGGKHNGKPIAAYRPAIL